MALKTLIIISFVFVNSYFILSQGTCSFSINTGPILSYRNLVKEKNNVNSYVAIDEYIKGRNSNDSYLVGLKSDKTPHRKQTRYCGEMIFFCFDAGSRAYNPKIQSFEGNL